MARHDGISDVTTFSRVSIRKDELHLPALTLTSAQVLYAAVITLLRIWVFWYDVRVGGKFTEYKSSVPSTKRTCDNTVTTTNKTEQIFATFLISFLFSSETNAYIYEGLIGFYMFVFGVICFLIFHVNLSSCERTLSYEIVVKRSLTYDEIFVFDRVLMVDEYRRDQEKHFTRFSPEITSELVEAGSCRTIPSSSFFFVVSELGAGAQVDSKLYQDSILPQVDSKLYQDSRALDFVKWESLLFGSTFVKNPMIPLDYNISQLEICTTSAPALIFFIMI